MLIDVAKGTVTVRSTGKDGKEEVATDRQSLPHDLFNGLIPSMSQECKEGGHENYFVDDRGYSQASLGEELAITPRGTESFLLAGALAQGIGIRRDSSLEELSASSRRWSASSLRIFRCRLLAGKFPLLQERKGRCLRVATSWLTRFRW